MKKPYKFASIVVALALSGGVVAPASGATIQLGFILDRSGSIGSGNWTTIVNGLSTAINTHIPVGGTDTYEVSVVSFASSATINIANFLVTDATTRSTLATNIAAIAYSGGGTVFADAFAKMQDALDNTSLGNTSLSYVNFATDGVQADPTAGKAARDALIAAGVDNISIEGIGSGVDAGDLQTNYCHPGPCDTTSPYNFPAQGFYVGVANAAGYAAAIGNKIQVVTGQTPVPATVALLGLGLLGIGALRRRKS